MRNHTTVVILAVVAIGLVFSVIAFADGIFDFGPVRPTAAAASQAPASSSNPAKPTPAPASQPAEHRALPTTAPATSAPAQAAGPSIIVAYARYGSGNRWADVTEPCRGLVREHGLKFPRDMHRVLGIDPVPGYMKFLELSLVINGTEVWLRVADNLQLDPLSIATEPPQDPK